MKQFMDKDFLLSTPTAQTLFHEYAEKMPILDYHCHINPKEIAEDRKRLLQRLSVTHCTTGAILNSRDILDITEFLTVIQLRKYGIFATQSFRKTQ